MSSMDDIPWLLTSSLVSIMALRSAGKNKKVTNYLNMILFKQVVLRYCFLCVLCDKSVHRKTFFEVRTNLTLNKIYLNFELAVVKRSFPILRFADATLPNSGIFWSYTK